MTHCAPAATEADRREVIATAAEAEARLWSIREPDRAEVLQRFFKTSPGEYGDGDKFLGIRVPVLRKLSRETRAMPITELVTLLRSAYHEARLLALLGIVEQYKRSSEEVREQLYQVYLGNTRWINNWDLVDVSAEHIVGAHLVGGDHGVLEEMAVSDWLWDRRIAIMATFHFIRRGEYGSTLKIAEALLDDAHDLIHKAVGWMLREVGKRDREELDRFLKRRYKRMPRTMLRYAIEKHDPAVRVQYLRGEVQA
jgi:3-methyladenine DNA glycosylase AlkD